MPDPLDNIPAPADLPGSPVTEDDVQRWLDWITMDVGKGLTKNGAALHAGQTITFRHPVRGRGLSSMDIWKKDGALRVAKLLEEKGYEAKVEFEEKPDEPVLKIRIKK